MSKLQEIKKPVEKPAKEIKAKSGVRFFVDSADELPIRLSRNNGIKKTPAVPQWLQEVPKGKFMSPIMLVRAGLYNSSVSAQVTLSKWVERGELAHPARGTYERL